MSDRDAPIDISIPFASHIPSWPGDVTFECGWTARRENGSSVNLSHMHFSAHSGTHADAPLHVESAWGASESLPLAAFVGDALVVHVPSYRDGVNSGVNDGVNDGAGNDTPGNVRIIDLAVLQLAMRGRSWCPRLLIRTGAVVSERGFPDAWPSLDESAVDWLLSQGLLLLGVDCPSVDSRHSTTLPVHHALFSRGAYVLENLSLNAVSPGAYELCAAPLLIVGADAAPVRALLRRR